MRAGEVHGQDYFFVTREQFEVWLEEGDGLLEHALVYGDYKGIPRQQVLFPRVGFTVYEGDGILEHALVYGDYIS